MRWAVILGLGLLLSGCITGSPSATDRQLHTGLLEYVEGLAVDGHYSPTLAPLVVEVAWAAGLNPAEWPASSSAVQDVAVPENGSLLSALRPLYALALASEPQPDARRQRILEGFDGTQFGNPQLLNDDAYAVLALLGDGYSPASPELQASGNFLLAHQHGGWSYGVNGTPGTDMTGIILTGLQAANRLDDVNRMAVLDFLTQVADGGGYAETPNSSANCDSTVWAIRSFAVLGEEVPIGAWTFLASLRQPDGGFAYKPGGASDAFCSLEAATLYGLKVTGRLEAKR